MSSRAEALSHELLDREAPRLKAAALVGVKGDELSAIGVLIGAAYLIARDAGPEARNILVHHLGSMLRQIMGRT